MFCFLGCFVMKMVKFNYEQNKYICTMVWPDS